MPRGRQSLQSDGVHELPPPPINPASPADREQQSFLVVYHQIVRHTHVPAANCPVFRQNLKLRFVNDEQQLVSRAPRMHGGPHGLYVTSILTPCFDGDVRFRPVCGSRISERQQTPRCTRLATPLSLSLSLSRHAARPSRQPRRPRRFLWRWYALRRDGREGARREGR